MGGKRRGEKGQRTGEKGRGFKGWDNRGQYAHNKNRLFQTNVIFIVIIEAV